jgi:hypothetical protein
MSAQTTGRDSRASRTRTEDYEETTDKDFEDRLSSTINSNSTEQTA